MSSFSENIHSLDIVNFDTVADAIYAAMQQYVERKPVNKESEYLNLENQFVRVGESVKNHRLICKEKVIRELIGKVIELYKNRLNNYNLKNLELLVKHVKYVTQLKLLVETEYR